MDTRRKCEHPTSNIQLRTSKSQSSFSIGRWTLGVGRSPSSTSGQALIELVVGLVAIMVLAAVILQLGQLQRAHTEALLEARALAGENALAEDFVMVLPGPEYIRDWDVGGDERAYSRDDTPITGSAGILGDDILSQAQPQLLETYAPGNPISEYSDSASMDAYALVQGQSQSDSVPLLPIIQRLIYDTDSITMDASVWLTWTEGLE